MDKNKNKNILNILLEYLHETSGSINTDVIYKKLRMIKLEKLCNIKNIETDYKKFNFN